MRIPALIIAALIAATSLISTTTSAQPYPSRPIRLIVPFVAAGTTDTVSRIMAQHLSASLGQQVIVDNRPGATGMIGTHVVAKAPPDGYTLLFGSAGPNVILVGAYAKLPYDAVKDFAPISLIGYSDHILIVHPSLPVKSVKDLIVLARARPGQLTYSSAGTLSVAHMSGELFAQLAKVKLVQVAYKGGGQAIVGTFSGETSMYFGGAPTVVRYKDSGKVRFIATTGAKRMKTLPEVPTIGETLPGYDVTQWLGILAPAMTPNDVISRLHTEIVKAVANPRIAAQLTDVGADPQTTSPEEFAAYIKREISKWSKVVKAAGIVLE